jgi:hypothetical protein
MRRRFDFSEGPHPEPVWEPAVQDQPHVQVDLEHATAQKPNAIKPLSLPTWVTLKRKKRAKYGAVQIADSPFCYGSEVTGFASYGSEVTEPFCYNSSDSPDFPDDD